MGGLAILSSVLLAIFGALFGWFHAGLLWQIAEDRFAATSRADLDDEELSDESKEQRVIVWTMVPGGLGMCSVLFLPDRFMSLFWVGVGISMAAFGYVCFRSEHAFKEGRDADGEAVGKIKSMFILIAGIVAFCAGIFGLVSYVPVIGE